MPPWQQPFGKVLDHLVVAGERAPFALLLAARIEGEGIVGPCFRNVEHAQALRRDAHRNHHVVEDGGRVQRREAIAFHGADGARAADEKESDWVSVRRSELCCSAIGKGDLMSAVKNPTSKTGLAPRVLVVDDEPGLIELVSDVVGKGGRSWPRCW